MYNKAIKTAPAFYGGVEAVEKPLKPNFYNIWLAIKVMFYIAFYITIIRINMADNLWMFVPLLIWVAGCYFFDPNKYFNIFREFGSYNESMVKYNVFISEQAAEKRGLPSDNMVNENIARYLEEKKIRKQNARWWQFWV